MKMRFKKFFLLGAVAMALTTSLAFKPNRLYLVASIKSPTQAHICINNMLVDDDCKTYNTGDQCTAYYNPTYPSNLAYKMTDGSANPGSCVVPLYHEE